MLLLLLYCNTAHSTVDMHMCIRQSGEGGCAAVDMKMSGGQKGRRVALLTTLVATAAAKPLAAIVTLGPYPGVSVDAATIAGTLKIEAQGTDLLEVSGLITGVTNPTYSSGGWHVHEGFSCSAADEVGGHYFTGLDDPWAVQCTTPAAKNTPCYQPDLQGVAAVNATIRGYSLTGVMPVLGRALVVHDTDGRRVGCGLITPAMGEFVTIDAYPGVASLYTGMLMVSSESGGGLEIVGTLAGLVPSTSGGWHIHTGHTCETADPTSAIGERGPRGEGRVARAEGRGPRREWRGPRAEGRGLRAEGRGPRSEGRRMTARVMGEGEGVDEGRGARGGGVRNEG